jgi:hypothetical protein
MNGTPSTERNGDVAGVDELLGRLADQMTTLVTQELRLAQTETRSTVRQAAAGGALVASAGMAGSVGVVLLGLGARLPGRRAPDRRAVSTAPAEGSRRLIGWSTRTGVADGRSDRADREVAEPDDARG